LVGPWRYEVVNGNYDSVNYVKDPPV
jgi:hypothetical protein